MLQLLIQLTYLEYVFVRMDNIMIGSIKKSVLLALHPYMLQNVLYLQPEPSHWNASIRIISYQPMVNVKTQLHSAQLGNMKKVHNVSPALTLTTVQVVL